HYRHPQVPPGTDEAGRDGEISRGTCGARKTGGLQRGAPFYRGRRLFTFVSVRLHARRVAVARPARRTGGKGEDAGKGVSRLHLETGTHSRGINTGDFAQAECDAGLQGAVEV